MIDQKKLKAVLQSLDVESPVVEVVRASSGLIATVTSGSFSTMNEGQRQELVWRHLQEQLDNTDDMSQIEYVITNAPGELPEEEQVMA
jgi:hypothetical protein